MDVVHAEACTVAFINRFHAVQSRPSAVVSGNILHTRFSRWGLYSMMNNLAVVILGTVANNMTLCVRTEPWPYAPSPTFEAMHGCRGAACYLQAVDVLWPPACESPMPTNVNSPEIHDVLRKANPRQAGGALGAACAPYARSAVTRLLFRVKPQLLAQIDRSVAQFFGIENAARLPPYIAIHVRWGDKVREAARIRAEEYVAAASALCDKHRVRTILLATSSPAAITAIATQVDKVRPDLKLIVPTSRARMADEDFQGENKWLNASALPEDSFVSAYSDEQLIISAMAAVVTMSSNMGRFPYWYNYGAIQTGSYELINLDRDKRTGKLFVPTMSWPSWAVP